VTYDILAAFMDNEYVYRLFCAVSPVYLHLGFGQMMRGSVSDIAREERTRDRGVREVQ
jgi:hypothetical protein